MSQLQEEILKVNMMCDRCKTVWQFENIEGVAEKSIDHHVKSGECDQNYERRNRPVGTYYNSNYQSTTSTSSISWPQWGSPSRGSWIYHF